jgi:hypothetical protein
MPESPRTRFQASRARKVAGRGGVSGLVAPKRKQDRPPPHRLKLEQTRRRRKGRSSYRGICSCLLWWSTGSREQLEEMHAKHVQKVTKRR